MSAAADHVWVGRLDLDLRERGFDLPVRRLDSGHPACYVLDNAASAEVLELRALLGERSCAQDGARALDHVHGLPDGVGIASPGRVRERGQCRRRLLEERDDDFVEPRVPTEILPE